MGATIPAILAQAGSLRVGFGYREEVGKYRIALVTSAELPELAPEDQPLIPLLEERDADVDVQVWDDPNVDWVGYDLVLIRSTWDYTAKIQEFIEWARSLPNLVNPPNVVRWNSDKHYLQTLEEHGLPVVKTTWLEPNREFEKRDIHNRFPAQEEFVVKPAISAGSKDTGRYTATDANSRRFAIEHAHRLLQEGRSVMVQRYIKEVDSSGEAALIFLHGTFSHAVHKDAMLVSDDSDQVTEEYRPEEMSPHQATEQEIAAAQHVLQFARGRIPGRNPSSRPLLYARVDMVTPASGEPVLMELELVEPNLFCSLARGGYERFADAILAEVRLGKDTHNIDLA